MFACGSFTVSYENNDGSGNGFESTGYQAPRYVSFRTVRERWLPDESISSTLASIVLTLTDVVSLTSCVSFVFATIHTGAACIR